MFGFGGSVKIYYCPTPVNMRKSFDGLAGAVEEYIKQDPESGHVFAFFSRNKKLVKLLQWEDGGFVIWMKRLEQGGFHIPQSVDGRIELTCRELAAILSGIKPQRYYKTISNFAFSLLPLPGFTLPNFHSRRLEDIRHADPMPLLSPTFAGKSLPKFPRVTFLQGVAENLSAPTDFLLAFPFSPLYNTSHRTSFRKTLVRLCRQ